MTSKNRQEEEEVLVFDGNTLEVKARPGVGKTTLAVGKIVRAIRTGTKAKEVLILSFSNSAVDEFNLKLKARGVAGLDATTFHSLGSWLIRRAAKEAGFARPALTPVDPLKGLRYAVAYQFLVGAAAAVRLKLFKGDRLRKRAKAKLKERSSQIKSSRIAELLRLLKDLRAGRAGVAKQLMALRQATQLLGLTTSEVAGKMEDYQRFGGIGWAVDLIFRLYRDRLEAAGYIEYPQMCLRAATLLAKNQVTLPACKLLVVDEYQDCAAPERTLLAQLVEKADQTVVFGDDLQAIYGFAGGGYEPLSTLKKRAVVLPLTHSYRLTAEIAALAVSVAQYGGSRNHGGARSKSGSYSGESIQIDTGKFGRTPLLYGSSSAYEERILVCKKINALIAKGIPAAHIAVLARYRDDLKFIRRKLLQANVVREAAKSEHIEALRQVIHVVHAVETSHQEGKSLDVLRLTKLLGPGLAHKKWLSFLSELARVKSVDFYGRYRTVVRAYLRLRGGINFDKQLRNYLNEAELQMQPFGSAKEFATHYKGKSSRPSKSSGVTLSTVHGAKGKEWKFVFIVGVTQGHWPSSSLTRADEIEEEVRTLFVAITRASERVFLHWSPRPRRRDSGIASKVSRVLKHAISNKLVTVK